MAILFSQRAFDPAKESLRRLFFHFDEKKENNVDKFYLNGEDVSGIIREKEVNEIVSQVSHIPEVRAAMVKLQREMGNNLDIIKIIESLLKLFRFYENKMNYIF